LLQQGGATITKKDDEGNTALLFAAYNGKLDVVQWLLQEGGATIGEKNDDANTVLQLAASKGWQQLVNWLLIEGGFVFTTEEIGRAVEICFKINLSLLTHFYKFLSTNPSLPLTECVPLTQILAYTGEEKALLLDKSLSLLVSLFELLQKKALGMALYQLHEHELKPLLSESQLQIIERVSSELNTAHDSCEGLTETPLIPLISIPDVTNKQDPYIALDLVPMIPMIESIQTTLTRLDEGNTTANDSQEESTQTSLETQEYTKKSTAKRPLRDLKRPKHPAEHREASKTEPDNLQMMFERAKNMASQLTCEGRFFLTKETLEQLPAEERVKRLMVELEKAWELATKKDHPTGVEKNKEQLLIELQDFYYSLQKKPALNTPCFFQLFEEKVKAQPNKLAVIYDATTLSYQELNEKANRLAHYLIDLKKEKNWKNGTCIALFFENSIDAIISILAVMKAGLAYLPLTVDKHLSNERLTAYVKESEVTWLLVQDSLAHHGFMHFVKNKIDSLESQCFSHCQHKNKKNPALKIDPHQLAYTIFSSGSTGKPKGIPIAHKGLVNPIKAVEQAFQITANDRVGWHALLSFDASLLDIMTALGTGSTSVIIPQAIRTDGEKLTDYLKIHEVSIITLVPTVLETLNPASLPNLRGYISTGEAGRKGLFDYWHQTGRLQDQEPRIGLNGHGPTETSICFALGRYQIDRPMTPIGEIIVPGFEWFIMNLPSETCPYPRKPSLVREGEEGELYLAGPGLGLGYIDTKAPYQQR
ncbi:MAG: AMP-binding protein, partial [Tatlockia sp.]|nr:AMP-binding protein [Tatlockia sp.]